MPPFRDLTNQAFGRWKVIKRVENNKHNHPQWLCKCSCGNEGVVRGSILTAGQSKSCGCFNIEVRKAVCIARNTTHGLSSKRVYNIWVDMRQRCFNKSNPKYKIYGARGITVHPDWESFETFLNDMGCPPSEKHTLDRIDNGYIYCKSNCRWALQKTQQNNRSNNRMLTYKGEHKTLQQWCNQFKIDRKTVTSRIANGWTVENALEIRPKKGRNQFEETSVSLKRLFKDQ